MSMLTLVLYLVIALGVLAAVPFVTYGLHKLFFEIREFFREH